jgi:hypothetical protein
MDLNNEANPKDFLSTRETAKHLQDSIVPYGKFQLSTYQKII